MWGATRTCVAPRATDPRRIERLVSWGIAASSSVWELRAARGHPAPGRPGEGRPEEVGQVRETKAPLNLRGTTPCAPCQGKKQILLAAPSTLVLTARLPS